MNDEYIATMRAISERIDGLGKIADTMAKLLGNLKERVDRLEAGLQELDDALRGGR